MAERSRAISDEELFMSRPAEDCDSPTVEPLRIFKPQSPKPTSGSHFKYPLPPSAAASTPAAASSFSAASTAPPAFPLPPGASSSANPLPYPLDDEQILRPRVNTRLPGPDGRAHNSSSPAYNDTSPRLGMSPTGNGSSKKPGLAERRGTVPASLSPSSPVDDLFAKPINPAAAAQPKISTSYQNKLYYPPPAGASKPAAAPTAPVAAYRPDPDSDTLKMAVVDEGSNGGGGGGMTRFSSTASTSTTRANRGSPPPPETPVMEPGIVPGGGIEARYAAAGISGTATLNSLSQSAAAAERYAQYGRRPQPAQQPTPAAAAAAAGIPRPWTPTESPDNQPHGPPTVYQGATPIQQTAVPVLAAAAVAGASTAGESSLQVSVLEQDFQRMQASTPPPAYTSLHPNASGAYPNDKQQAAAAQARANAAAAGAGVSAANRVPVTAAAAVTAAPSATTTAAAAASGSGPYPTVTTAAPHMSGPATAGMTAAGATAAAATAAAAAGMAAAGGLTGVGSDGKHAAGAAGGATGVAGASSSQPLMSPLHAGHPAFANEAKPSGGHGGATGLMHTPSVAAGLASPPPLPEGWISHLDQNSGQYYYIHLATQATQWEFPKGPTPLHHDPTPLSPATSTYGNPLASPFMKQSLASPLMSPLMSPGMGGPGLGHGGGAYAESILSMSTAAPSAAGFQGPPPSAGVDMYRIAPTNGVYFGPYLRYVNMDVERGVWLGSIMIVTDAPQPPTIHIHRSVDLSPNPRQLQPHIIYTHQRWSFYKYDVDLAMGEAGTERWTYAVTSHLGCTRYEFVVAGKHELGWRFLAHSGNDFSPLTSQNERNKLGGLDVMWKDVLQKNVECGGFHVQLGLGDQIYGDRLWREVPLLQQWLAISGRENRRNVPWTARHEEDVTHAYFHYYTSHFDQPFLREAFAQIPHILQVNDHEIFDGFGSYPDYMQQTAIFKNIGRIAMEMYLLFQHHTTIEVLRNVHTDQDLFTVTGAGWHFIKYLGPAVVVVGPDCRSERTQARVLAGPTYQGLFPKVALLPPSVQHCLWMVSVPIVYPRLETVETLANTLTTGKKAVNTTYNLLANVTSSVAGVVGGKEVVQQGFSSVKKALGKNGLMGSMLNNFGELGISEELRDLWTHESKDLERTYLIRTLQGIAKQKGIRMTFLSGDVHCSGAGLVHDPTHPSDHKTMYQIITSPVVGAPTNNYMLKMLHNNRLLYVPQNGHLSTHEVSDTKEDMMEIFQVEATGQPREYKKLMNRRNYVAVVAYDPEAVAGTTYAASVANGQQGLSKLSLAVDYIVQADVSYGGAATKYGPVIVPHLEFGH